MLLQDALINRDQEIRELNTTVGSSTSYMTDSSFDRQREVEMEDKDNARNKPLSSSSVIISKADELLEKNDGNEDEGGAFARFIADYMLQLPFSVREKAKVNMLNALYETVYEENK